MFPFWLILGLLLILLGIVNKQVLSFLGIKLMSEAFTNPSLVQSTRFVERIGQWLVITLGASFIVQGLGTALPHDISSKISFALLGLAGLMLVAMIGITLVHWKVK